MSQLDPSTSLSLSSPSLICIKLEDPNFGVWKPRMTYALQSRKLWWHASGKSTRPVRKAGEKDDEYQSKVDKWDEDDEAASALICMYIGDSQLHHVSGCTSAAETWTKLLAAHEKRGMNHALQFVHGISSARLLEDGKVQEYINKMRSDNDRLRATGLGIEYNDALLAAHLMFSFPASYEPIKMTLATLEQKDFTFETVSRAMLNEDARRAVAASASAVPAPVLRNDGEAAALAAATATLQAAVGKKTRQDTKDKLVCNWCGLKRHVEATCWKKKGGHPQQVRNQHPPQSNLAQSQDGNIFLALACDHLRDSAVDDGSDVAVTAPLVAAAGSTALAADEPCVSVHARLPPKTAPGPNSKLSWYIDSERSNRTIVEAARAMLHSSQLPHELWTEAVTAAAYIRNRCTTRAVDGKTPYEAWWGVKPSIGHLRVWGCLAYPHRPASHRAGKWDVKAIRCSMVGYSPNSNTYRLWDHVNRKIIESRDVVFVEDKLARDVGAGPDATVQTSELLQLPEQLIQLPNDGLSDISEPILRAAVGGSVLPAAPSESDDELVLPYIPLSSVREEKEQLPALIPPPVPSGVGVPQQAILPPSALQPHQQSQPSVPSSAKLPLALRKLLDHNSPGEKDLAPSAVAMNSPESSADSLGLLCALVSRLSRVEDSTADPTTLKQARDCANAKHWEPEIQAEMNSMRRAEVWDAVELPDGKHAIDSRLVFKTKRDAAGNIIRYKVRLCAKGFSQRPGVDYSETFAPVARLTSIRAILAMVAHHDWELDQMDVQSAYLNAPLTEEVYMRLPEGLAAAGERHLVCKLKKSIYGLKQAGREWNKHVDAALKSLGFIQILADACIYVYQRGNVIVINSLYVDDLLLCSNNRGRLNIVKQELEDRYQMTDLGEARYVLGIEIRRDRRARTLSILQVGYVKEILERFQMSGCRPISTPMDSNNKLVAATDEDALDATATKDYQARVGALMYAMLGTRPDISYAVTALSQFCSKPSTIHAQAVKRVFRYLNGTIQHGITYRGTEPTSTAPTLLGYCDSDWAEDRVDRRSITGYVFLLANAAVSWKSRKQDTIALSSVEAEYMAATEAVKEALWWRMFLRGVGYATPDPTTILSDSQGSIAISLNSVNHQRTKHIDVRHHFIREHIREKNVRLQYVSTTQMAADILTKALGSVKHNPIKELTGMRQV